MPQLRDAYGKVVIAGPRGDMGNRLIAAGATSIVFDRVTGARKGVYVDNETPGRDQVAKKIVAMIPGELVVVGLYPSEPGHRIAGCVCAYEWYPFHQGWGPCPPGEQAYITQWEFAWPGDRPPTPAEASQLLQRAASYKPRLLWVY